MDHFFFCGGGFKTFFYFQFLEKIIASPDMPFKFAGSSSGTISASVAAALKTVHISDRAKHLDMAKKKLVADLLDTTRPWYMNWFKCSVSARVAREICESIQPDVSKLSDGSLSMLITHYTFPFTFERHVASSWNTWGEFEQDIRCGSSIPLIQDYWLNVDKTNHFAIDGDFLPYGFQDYKLISCSPCETAHCAPSNESCPKWYHLIYNPMLEDIDSWK